MTFTNCTINGEAFEVADSPVTFGQPLNTVEVTDHIQFENGLAPSGPNCQLLFNSHVLVGQCIYSYRKQVG